MKSLAYYFEVHPTLALVEALLARIEHSNGLEFVPEATLQKLAQELLNHINTNKE